MATSSILYVCILYKSVITKMGTAKKHEAIANILTYGGFEVLREVVMKGSIL
jgi:hypothetical protein